MATRWDRARRVGGLASAGLVAAGVALGVAFGLILPPTGVGAGGVSVVPDAVPSSLDPFAPVRAGDAAYQCLAQLQEAGLVRAVAGGPGQLSRYEFAVSLAQLLQSATGSTGTGAGDRPSSASQAPGVRPPATIVVDSHSIDRVLKGVSPQQNLQVRRALTTLLVQFAGELEVLGFHVALPSVRPEGAAGVVPAPAEGASMPPNPPGRIPLPPGEYPVPTSLPGLTGTPSPLEWSYLLGQPGGVQTGLSGPRASVGVRDPGQPVASTGRWGELTVGQGATALRADALVGPWAAQVDVIMPVPDVNGPEVTPVLGLDTRWQMSDAASLRWWWGTPVQPEAFGKSALTSAGQGEMTSLGGTLAVSPQLSLEGEVARHQTADPAIAQVGASRVGASVALGDVQVGASYRWVEPGFRPLLGGGQTPTTGSTVNMQLRRDTWQVSAQLERSQGEGESASSQRQVVALGLTYDLSNLALLRAGYEWSDLWRNDSGGALVTSSERRMQVGVGVQQGGAQRGVRADLSVAGASRSENEGFTLSTTAALEYRLLPWNARLVAGLGQAGAGLSTSLQLGYEPSADTSVWVGYQLVDYGKGEQKPTGPSDNQAQAGLTIRF